MNYLDLIEQRFGFSLPANYRRWSELGYTDIDSSSCLFFWEAEWIRPGEIPDYELSVFDAIDGLVPFAFNGAGDLWCWYLKNRSSGTEPWILFCPHDEADAMVYAPSFAGWFYRSALDYASSCDSEDEAIQECKGNLELWSTYLEDLGQRLWANDLRGIARLKPSFHLWTKLGIQEFGLISEDDVTQRVLDSFGNDFVDQELKWQHWGEA